MSTFSSELVRPASFLTLNEAVAAAPSNAPFVTMWNAEDEVRELTFGEFRLQAEAFALNFQSKGLRQGDPVILIMPQGIELMTAFVGAMLLGGVPAILAYPNFKVDPDKYRLGLAGVTANLSARLVVLDNSFPQELMDYVAVNEQATVIRGAEPPSNEARLSVTSPGPDSLAFIQHSAGTTGLQKGVALTHAAVLKQLGHLADRLHIGSGDSIYSWLPLYHDMGLIACFILPLTYHLPLVMQSPTDWVMRPGSMLKLITDYRCTLAWVPNFALQFLARRVHQDELADFDLSSLRALINCSEPVCARSMVEFSTAYKSSSLQSNALQSSYAMAENVFAVTQSDITAQPRRIWVDGVLLRTENIIQIRSAETPGATCLVSSGRCLPNNAVRIVSSEGHELRDGNVGEILICSDSLFEGYYNRPDLSEQSLSQGWYRSGDLGFMLEEELFVIGRKKDLIIVGGKNIYPQDVEEVAFSHPAIHDGRAVAFGMFNSSLGTEDIIITAEVETEEDLERSLDIERAVRNAIIGELGVAVRSIYLKPPRWIVKSTAGKAARAATREKLLREHPELSAH